MTGETFGQRLRRLREEAGLTQQELSERAGVHKIGLSKLERDENGPTWSTVQALARALGISCSAFEGTVEPPEERQPAKKGRPRTRLADMPAETFDEPPLALSPPLPAEAAGGADLPEQPSGQKPKKRKRK